MRRRGGGTGEEEEDEEEEEEERGGGGWPWRERERAGVTAAASFFSFRSSVRFFVLCPHLSPPLPSPLLDDDERNKTNRRSLAAPRESPGRCPSARSTRSARLRPCRGKVFGLGGRKAEEERTGGVFFSPSGSKTKGKNRRMKKNGENSRKTGTPPSSTRSSPRPAYSTARRSAC